MAASLFHIFIWNVDVWKMKGSHGDRETENSAVLGGEGGGEDTVIASRRW